MFFVPRNTQSSLRIPVYLRLITLLVNRQKWSLCLAIFSLHLFFEAEYLNVIAYCLLAVFLLMKRSRYTSSGELFWDEFTAKNKEVELTPFLHADYIFWKHLLLHTSMHTKYFMLILNLTVFFCVNRLSVAFSSRIAFKDRKHFLPIVFNFFQTQATPVC